jgi:hypothetical protein
MGENLIEIDMELPPKKYLNVLCHELVHHCFPDASESKTNRTAGVMAGVIWQQGFRKVQGE